MKRVKVMFLCTGNSCRSQMAEGFAKAIAGEKLEVYSAGLEAHGVNPRAIRAMSEIGIDISRQTSDEIDPALLSQMDYAITLCGNAEERCPLTPPSVKRLHWGLDDPAKASGTEEEIMAVFRTVRDDLRRRIEEFVSQVIRG